MEPTRRGRAASRLTGVAGDDLVLPLLVTVVCLLEVWVPALSSGAAAEHRPLLTLTALVAGGGLVVRRTCPPVTLALVLAAYEVQVLVAEVEAVSGIATVLLAIYAVSAWADRRRAVLVLLVLFAWVALHSEDLADVGFGWLLMAGPLIAGQLVRSRQLLLDELQRSNAALRAERDKAARLAVAEERARIAREVHDVVAHSLSVMVVQASAAEAQLTSPHGSTDGAAEALRAVQQVGRDALTETRGLVSVLHDDLPPARTPQPTLDDVEALVSTVRNAGLPVELRVEGALRPVPDGIALIGYRVLQEALTNVVKHAGPTRAEVRISYLPHHVQLEVRDHGAGPAGRTASTHSDGRGLIGMRQRVESSGGALDLQVPQDGGFLVRARLPAAALVASPTPRATASP